MGERFLGHHCEWNLGSPGGWDYQRMAQELGRLSWERIKRLSGIDIKLDFDHHLLNPVPTFARMLLRAHKQRFGSQEAFIVLLAEEETLDKVGENIHFVDYLNHLPGVTAALTSPQRLESKGDTVTLEGRRITAIFLDFNNNVIVKLKKKHNLDPLISAIRQGIAVNPRGIEPVGAKGIFEVVTGEHKSLMSRTTVSRTPWTRQFYPRSTIGPSGDRILDLVEWVRDHWEKIILKPVHGYSGKGIIIGYQYNNPDKSLQQALDSGGYIVQLLTPLELWAEEFPWIDRKENRVFIKRWQTDFRCFITDAGLIGFVARFGGVPTNVGSGGGAKGVAILRSRIGVKEAIDRINKAVINLGYRAVAEIQEEIEKKAIELGFVYLLGPIMTTLRPRIITPRHLSQLQYYSKNLWEDAIKLSRLWREGKLTKFAEISEEEEEIARLAPWDGGPALICTDGLYSFGGHLINND
ncbi:MAG: hypothetical protein JSU92_05645 [Deltaproteobacteria bacterium]|nr:MAG: hypothetical protein JSU92_05645 [Deltaproteobacteria bacterium]